MPTPFGSRGGMAFSPAELRVLRRSLAHALQSSSGPLTAAEVQDCLRLAHAVDDAVDEADRLRAFLLADLRRYRDALPGSVTGYLELLQDALAGGYEPGPDDLTALRALRGNPVAAALLDRFRPPVPERSGRRRPGGSAPRTRLLALAGGRAVVRGKEAAGAAGTAGTAGNEEGAGVGRAAGGKEEEGGGKPVPAKPAPGSRPAAPRPDRPVPTPGEVFPPRRKPTPPPAASRVAG
ncbi:hypothetical protein [Streptomyces sp. NPDC089799]|uniref:hypothetical protein n=1 Tax=Streptomyces sp. NPDC089799 TaxID=3155066 RepID=UPI00343C5508